MARCGRCGLWAAYPSEHREKQYSGICMWYQIRLPESEVFESRECGDFQERIPGMCPKEHFDYKIKRDNLGDAFVAAKFSKRLSITALVLSILGLTWNITKTFIQ
tara:strand:- start:416 stop:730 length:315 start_codon:yes stop_codon:yes gene_type:complete